MDYPTFGISTLSWPAGFVLLLIFMFARSSIIISLAYVWVRFSKFAKRHKVYRQQAQPGQLASEIRAAILVVLTDTVIVFFTLMLGIIQLAANPGWPLIIFSFLAAFLLAEVWFYASHRLLHDRRLYWIHRQHHVAKVTDPVTALSFSVLERAIFVTGLIGLLVLVSLLVPLARPGILGYAFLAYIANVIGHSNVEIVPRWIVKSRLGGLFYTPSYHSMHHARFHGHYGLYTTVLDRVFGTYFKDYPAVYERAAAGNGLTRLNETIETKAS